MDLHGRLATARDQIANRFIRQCRDGPQNTGLPADVKACGQRLDETDSDQRGVHGTAAAIRVLSERDDHDSRLLLPQLIRYVSGREHMERPGAISDVREDASNVIKVSEVILGLRRVNVAVAPTEELRNALSKRLLDAMIGGAGWDYYMEGPQQTELLPTAFALQALAAEGYTVEGPVQSLLAEVMGKGQGGGVGTADISVKVFCLYVLTFGKVGQPLVEEKKLKPAFAGLWTNLSALLRNEDLEQNIEYEYHSSHRYVRVPWQLYLLALAARLAPFRSFASYSVQSRLKSILAAATSPAGFVYPHSGSKVSARTNAILYGVLGKIDQRLPVIRWMLLPGMLLDRMVSSRLTAIAARAFALGLAAMSVLLWVSAGSFSIAVFGPDIASAVLLFLLSIRRAR